jgi:predicted DNA-binding transcriptional regulator AlpA
MIEQRHAYNERETAQYLGVSRAVLRLWRSRGEGPCYFHAGKKLVRYRHADLDLWIESRLSDPRSSAAKAEQASTQMTARQ